MEGGHTVPERRKQGSRLLGPQARHGADLRRLRPSCEHPTLDRRDLVRVGRDGERSHPTVAGVGLATPCSRRNNRALRGGAAGRQRSKPPGGGENVSARHHGSLRGGWPGAATWPWAHRASSSEMLIEERLQLVEGNEVHAIIKVDVACARDADDLLGLGGTLVRVLAELAREPDRP